MATAKAIKKEIKHLLGIQNLSIQDLNEITIKLYDTNCYNALRRSE